MNLFFAKHYRTVALIIPVSLAPLFEINRDFISSNISLKTEIEISDIYSPLFRTLPLLFYIIDS